jgi:hypothetical protein
MKIVGFGPKEVGQKMKNIRTTYKQEVQKIMKSKRSGSSSGRIYKPKVPWFQITDPFLSFLHKVPPTLSNINDVNNDEESIFRASSGNNTEDTIHWEKTTEPEYSSEINTDQECSPQGNSAKKRRLNLKQPLTPSYISDALDKLTKIRKTVLQQNSDETEFELWAKSLAVQLNSMETSRALKLQLQIQSLVTNERLEHETRNGTQNIPPSFALQQAHTVDSHQPISHPLTSVSKESTYGHYAVACNSGNGWRVQKSAVRCDAAPDSRNAQNPVSNQLPVLSPTFADDSIVTIISSVCSLGYDDTL